MKFKLLNKKLNMDSFTNLIAEGTSIDGKVSFSGTMKIQGEVMGDVISGASFEGKNNDCLIVDTTGSVLSSNVKTGSAIIAGKVACKELWVEDTLRVLAGAQITGAKLYYRTLEIEPGALITGCEMNHLDHVSKGEIV